MTGNAMLSPCAAATQRRTALKGGHRTGLQLWKRVKSTSFRLRLATAAMFMPNDEDNSKGAMEAIESVLETAKTEEAQLTPIVQALAQLNGGRLEGLDYRFKAPTSLFRKVMARLDKGLAEALDSSQGLLAEGSREVVPAPSPADILTSILDVLRYCAIFATKHYTRNVRAMLSGLEEQGIKQLRVKNYWGPGDGYQGINSVFVSAGGFPFELQVRCRRTNETLPFLPSAVFIPPRK